MGGWGWVMMARAGGQPERANEMILPHWHIAIKGYYETHTHEQRVLSLSILEKN